MSDAGPAGARAPRRRFRDWSIGAKLVVLVLATSTLPLLVLGAGLHARARAVLEADAIALLGARADATAASLDDFHASHAARAARAAAYPTIGLVCAGDLEARAHAAELLALEDAPEVDGLAIWRDPEGPIVTHGHAPVLPGAPAEPPAHVVAAQRGERAISGVLVTAGGVPAIAYAAPVAPGCAVVATVRAEGFWARVRAANGRAGAGSFALVLDAAGIRVGHGLSDELLFHPTGPLAREERDAIARERRFGADTRERLDHLVPAPELYALARAPSIPPERVSGRAWLDSNRVQNLWAARRLQRVPWTVVVFVPEETALARAAPFARDAVLALGVVTLLAFGAGLLLAADHARPIRALAAAARALRQGDGAARTGVAGRRDELGVAAEQFDAMAEALGRQHALLEEEVQARTRELEEANEELTSQRAELEARTREAEQATRMKSDFLAAMSHELRTPLNSVIGFTELVLEEAGPTLAERHARQLGDVLRSARHLLGLIDEVLDLAKVEAGRLELRLTAVDPRAALADAEALVTPAAQRRRVTLARVVRGARLVHADPGRLRQVLLNLLSNAIRHSPEGGTVTLAAEDAGDRVRFEVVDEGPGIPPELLPRLFEPFTQGPAPGGGRPAGTGLGLAISRRLVAAHGGELEAGAATGGGARFAFTLPAAPAPLAPAPTPAPLPPAPRAGARVLVADADPRVRELLAELLREGGFRAEAAATGAEALAAARRERPALVLLDLGLADLPADEVLRSLDAHPATREVPVIVLADRDLAGDERARLARRVSRIARKDEVTRAELVPVARAAIGGGPGSARAPWRPPTVLVVDDNDQNRTLARALLERLGCAVVEAADGAPGVERARAGGVDLVLLDLAMPGMDGYAALRALRADAATAGLPVVALTAHAMAGEEARARAAGFDAFLTKPVDRGALAAILERLARGREG